MHTWLLCTNLKEGAYLEDLGGDSTVILQWKLTL